MPKPRESSKCPAACLSCRVKKVKCDGCQPCKSCLTHGIECMFPPVSKRTRNKNLSERHTELEGRLKRMEAALMNSSHIMEAASASTVAATVLSTHDGGHSIDPGQSVVVADDDFDTSYLHQMSIEPDGCFTVDPSHEFQALATDGGPSPAFVPCKNTLPEQPYHHATGPTNGTEPTLFRNQIMRTSNTYDASETGPDEGSTQSTDTGSVLLPNPDGDMGHGQCSYLSVISAPALRWITDRAGSTSLKDSLGQLGLEINRLLTIDGDMQPARAPEPDDRTAWEYTRAFFDRSFDVIFGTIDRGKFESRLQRHLKERLAAKGDPAWYALRNTVYAYGCKLSLLKSGQPDTFKESQTRAWQYFSNALSVHTELIYISPSLASVQALLLMAFFVDTAVCPSLLYMLISNAMRSAQCLGLHLEAPASALLDDGELEERRRVFWSIYIFDKQLAFRSGRPSTVQDDNISCPLPSSKGDTATLDFVNHAIRHAQLLSAIQQKLHTVRALRQSFESTMTAVRELEMQLEHWADSLPRALRPGTPLQRSKLPADMHPYLPAYLHLAYHGALISIHISLAYPWIAAASGTKPNALLENQARQSSEVLAKASRQIAVVARQFESDISSPIWLSMLHPMVALINIFINVLVDPAAATAMSDVTLMEFMVGHFSYFDFASAGAISFPSTRSLVANVRTLVEQVLAAKTTHELSSAPAETTMVQTPNALNNMTAFLMDEFDGDLNGFGVMGGMDGWHAHHYLPSGTT